MKNLGIGLIIFGLLLIIFQMAGCQNEKPSTLTDWMNNWGANVSWGIKVGMIIIGIVLVAASNRKVK